MILPLLFFSDLFLALRDLDVWYYAQVAVLIDVALLVGFVIWITCRKLKTRLESLLKHLLLLRTVFETLRLFFSFLSYIEELTGQFNYLILLTYQLAI